MPGTWNLADLFEGVVDRVGDREAVVVGEDRLTYDGLDRRADRTAHLLAAHGVGPGDRVGIALRNGHEHLSALLGAYKLRAVPFNVNYRYTAAEMAYLLRDATPRVLLHGPDLGDAVDPAVAEVAAEGLDVTALVGRGPEHEARLGDREDSRPSPEGRSDDDLYLLYTGGTTGMPKGVEWRHHDIVFAALGAGRGATVVDGDATDPPATPAELVDRAVDGRAKVVVASPLIHGTAQWVALATLLGGGTVLMLPTSTFSPEALWDLADRERAGSVVVVGDAFGRPLVDALAARPDRWDLSHLVAFVSGGAVLSPTVRDDLARLLPWTAIVDGYGTSETGGQGNTVTWPGQRPAWATRFPLGPHTAVLDEDLAPLVPGIDTGRIGMIARRGHLPLRYRNDPERTAATFPEIDGERWAIPGDLGRVEADGTVTLLGRGASSINTGGEKVFPDEVEGVLKALPEVFDAAVVGTPDERWGERVVALVVPRAGHRIDDEAVDAHCREHLAAYKLPRRLLVVDRIRRQPSGKVDLAWLRSTALEAAGGDPARSGAGT